MGLDRPLGVDREVHGESPKAKMDKTWELYPDLMEENSRKI